MGKKLFIAVFAVAFVCAFTVSTSMADWYYNMNVTKVEAGDTGIVLQVKDDAGNPLQKYLSQTSEKSLLAIALTAQSLSTKVHCFYDPGSDVISSLVLSTE
jgi:type III secretory pathway component EscR